MKDGAKKNCLVTGATGALAPVLIRRLLARGYRVSALARNFSPVLDEFRNGDFRFIQGDITDAAVVKKAFGESDIVFHLAAKLHINNPSKASFEEYRAVNVGGTENLLNEAAKNRTSFIYASTINVYGTSDGGQIFDENSPTSPDGIYAETKLEAEKNVLANGGTAMRLAAIYGRRMKGNFPRLCQAVINKRFIYPNSGLNRRTLIFDDDASEAFVSAAESNVAGQILNVTDGKVYTLKQIVETIAAASGKKAPKLHIPEKLSQITVEFLDGVLKIFGKNPFAVQSLAKISEDIAVSGDKIQRMTSFRPQVSLEKGWRAIIDHAKLR